MPLSPAEQQELDMLEREEAASSQSKGLTPAEAQELAQLEAEEASQGPESGPTALEAGGRGALQGVTLGLADEGSGIVDALLSKTGNLFVPEGGANPYADKSFGEAYGQGRDEERAKNRTAEQAQPGAYIGGQVAGGMALPGGSIKSLAAQGLAAGFGGSEAEGMDLAKDTALGGGIAAAGGKAFEMAGKGLGKLADTGPAQAVKNAIMNSKYGKAFQGGSDVQKFTDAGEQTDLANRVAEAIQAKVGGARLNHAQAREKFTSELGSTPMDTSDIAQGVESSVGRFGPNAQTSAGEFGAVVGKDAEQLAQYTTALKEPRSAQELYRIWDDIKAKVDYNDQMGVSSEFNNQLKALQAGIKEKLHTLSPDIASADSAMSTVADQSKHLARGANETSNESFLATLGGRQKGNRREAFDSLVGKENPVAKEVDNFQTYQSFNGQGGFGSDYGLKNAAGIAAGGAVGYGAGGDSTSGTVGSIVGGALSSGRTQRALVTKAGDLWGSLSQAMPRLSPKYQKVLQDAQSRGGRALAVTHFLLSNEDPEYQAQTSQQP